MKVNETEGCELHILKNALLKCMMMCFNVLGGFCYIFFCTTSHFTSLLKNAFDFLFGHCREWF